MTNKLFVGNLSYSLLQDDLTQIFNQIGEVESVKIITDKETNRSKGFGFVEMQSKDDAQKAISELDGKEVDGRALRVNEATEKPRDNKRRR